MAEMAMVLEYVRDTYQVPAYVGRRVRFTGYKEPIEGTIVGERAGMIRVRPDGLTRSFNFHPTWKIEYLPVTRNREP
jgi:hypothetical protein